MSFTQEKIDRATIQSRGIFNTYVYTTADTVAQVQAVGYFKDCRFAVLDGPLGNSTGWHNGIIEARCSDGYMIGTMDAATGTMTSDFISPNIIEQIDLLDSESGVNQIPSGLGVPLQISFGPTMSTPDFDLDVTGTLLCKTSGQYRFVLSAQAGRVGAGGVANLYLRALLDAVQIGSSVHAKLDDADTITPLRFNLTLNMEAGQVLTTQIVQGPSGIAAGGLYAAQPSVAGWAISPSASMLISQLRIR